MARRAGGRQLSDPAPGRTARRLRIQGVVQGVGFRPFLYRLAQQCGVSGWVRNTSWGVDLHIEGPCEAVTAFERDLPCQAPEIARIVSIESESEPVEGNERFEIRHSQAQAGAYQLVSPDLATCTQCLHEIRDPSDRRFRYPFANCTNCGPRFTIIEAVPYDRPKTTMQAFRMCPACQAEYDDPLNRRFHAQPNACPVCGPQVTLCDAQGAVLAERDDAMRQAAERLLRGDILAIKGLGGFQLACDARNAQAVARLRERKRRLDKPFAVMVADLGAAESQALLSDGERSLLTSTAAPIVLCRWRKESDLAREVGPDTHRLGLMLPYTPLHHILLGDVACPLVMTSGNLSEEPIARDNDEALRRLGAIADAFLLHNRDIRARYDDSVWFVPATGPQPLRRARGYAPFPIRLPEAGPSTLACGAELKNTFCLTRDDNAFLSQHIGDMENVETLEHWERSVALYRDLFDIAPEVIAYDMHPDYAVSRRGAAMPGHKMAVPHHHAHLASCLVDNGCRGPAIGVILDGTGYGLDGQIWGGEFLLGDCAGFQRAAHLQCLPLPGGDQAVRRPYRIAWAYLQSLLGDDVARRALPWVPADEGETLSRMIARGINTAQTSSAGRLFDAVAALLGLVRQTSYEAQAAIRLEMAADGARSSGVYPWMVVDADDLQGWGRQAHWVRKSWVVGLEPLLAAILDDVSAGASVGEIAYRFHATLAAMIVEVVGQLRKESGLTRVALSGGCWQNRLLLELSVPRLRDAGLEVLLHKQAPANDGGIALGQAAIAANRDAIDRTSV